MKKEEYLSLIDEVIAQGPYTDTWDSLCEHPVPKWYARDKFGIFIHWGVYSVPAFGNEWYPRNMYVKGSKENLHHTEKYGTLDKFGYKDFIPQFKAEKFDPKEWAALFKEAGAKFVVPVAEHHDGFQMYASDLCRWNAAEMGPKRDILGELKTEVEKEGMVLGASSHRAEHYWFFNGGRQIPEADVNDPEYADLYGPAAGITRDMTDIYDNPPTEEHMQDWLVRTCEIVDKYQPSCVTDSFCQLTGDISLRSHFYGIEMCIFTWEQAESVMMLGCQNNILRTCFFKDLCPLLRIPVFSFPHRNKIFVFEIFSVFFYMMLICRAFSNVQRIVIPFCIRIIRKPFLGINLSQLPCMRCKCRHGINSPVDKNSKFTILIPFWNCVCIYRVPVSCESYISHN